VCSTKFAFAYGEMINRGILGPYPHLSFWSRIRISWSRIEITWVYSIKSIESTIIRWTNYWRHHVIIPTTCSPLTLCCSIIIPTFHLGHCVNNHLDMTYTNHLDDHHYQFTGFFRTDDDSLQLITVALPER
jgi:hypothetical protein